MLTEFLRSFTLPGLEKKYIVADDSLTEEGAAADSKKVGQELAKKVDKETGKALSTNDYTNAEKTKLAGVDSGAQVNTIEGVKVDGTEVTPDAQKKVNLNVYDKAAIDAIVQAIYAEVAKKLNIDGYSELATVGNALGLVTDSVVEDKEPYNFRSLAHLPVGKFCYDTIVGGSIVWNQLVNSGDTEVTVPSGHKYYANINGAKSIGASTGTAISINDSTEDNVIDLTAALTPSIANYVYSLETATAGSGVAWFRKYFPGVYYGYSEPHFEHVQTSAKETVGFNQWDEEWENGYIASTTGENVGSSTTFRSKNYIPVLPNTTYYANTANYTSDTRRMAFYDSAKNYLGQASGGWDVFPNGTFTTPNGAYYMRFYCVGTTYNHDICVNIHGDRDGEYEPYKKRTYPLDSSLTLRGIPKLDSTNRLCFDGDIYRHDGSGEERYGFIDLGTLNWIVYRAERCIYRAVLQNLKVPGNTEIPNIMTPKYKTVTGNDTWVSGDIATTSSSTDYIFVCDTNYTDVASFKTAMSGVYLLYELKTPEPFTAEPFQSPMVVDPLGTEEFVDYAVEQGERDVKIPCGHTSEYPEDLVDKLEILPHATGTNGDYLITELNGKLYLKPYTQTVGLTSVSETEAE